MMGRRKKNKRPRFDMGGIKCRAVSGPDSNGRYYWRGTRYGGGTEEHVPIGRATEDEARKIVAATYHERPESMDKTDATVRDVVGHWDDAVQADGRLEESTRNRYERNAIILRDTTIAPVRVSALTSQRLVRLRDELGRTYSPHTVQILLSSLRAALTWAADYAVVPPDGLAWPEVKLRHTGNERTPTTGEVLAVLEHLTGWRYVCVYLLWSTGARRGEILHLRWADVDWSAGHLVVGIHEGARKTGRREIPMLPAVVETLREWQPEDARPDAYVLGLHPETTREVRRYLITACRKAGVPYFTVKSLRRLAGDTMAEHMDVAEYAAILGHSPATALKHYRRSTARSRHKALTKTGLGVVPRGEVIPLEREGS